MARAVTIYSSVLATIAFTVEQDSSVVGLSCTSNAVLSRDPNETWTGFNSPGIGTSGFRKDPISFAGSKVPPNGNHASVPVLSGEVIYCAFSAAGSAIIYFDP